jgi:DNA-nicking Smr family endonuclease
MKRNRILSREERELWAAVAADIHPLPGKLRPKQAPTKEEKPVLGDHLTVRPLAPSVNMRETRQLPPLQPIERPLRRALNRGRRMADAVLDLHGMHQGPAHAALRRFLKARHADGASVVIVVTGKGLRGKGDGEAGVLRRQVPHWLAMPDLRPLVIGIEEAGPRQGGAGALYVRLRRKSAP